jgi:hypothetical protein
MNFKGPSEKTPSGSGKLFGELDATIAISVSHLGLNIRVDQLSRGIDRSEGTESLSHSYGYAVLE